MTIHYLYIADYKFQWRIPFGEVTTPNGRKAKDVLITKSVTRDIPKEEKKLNLVGFIVYNKKENKSFE